MTTDEIKLEMEGLDKRTKKFKYLNDLLKDIHSDEGLKAEAFEETDYKVSDEIYNNVKGQFMKQFSIENKVSQKKVSNSRAKIRNVLNYLYK